MTRHVTLHTARSIAAGMGLLLVALTAIPAQQFSHQGESRVPVVVELFTSEGCSSCPPADRVLATLERMGRPGASGRGEISGLSQDVELIVLGEHVDYWDRLGWRDTFSSPLFSARQQNYGRAFEASEVYTPQMVINGRIEVLGSDYRAVREAIGKAAAQMANPANRSEVELKLNGFDKFQVRVGRLPASSKGADLLLAVTESDLETRVTAGENDGRRLRHTAVVRSLTKLAELEGGQENGEPKMYVAEARLNLRPEWRRDQLKLVLLVQDRETRAILGAAQVGL